MAEYLEFRRARCKDCYKCLRSCPVKAIDVQNHQAQIIEDRCILCGTCTSVCPQNAKIVHSELDEIRALLAGNEKVIASVAPSFISSFGLQDFMPLKIALGKLGFSNAEETAVGAKLVVVEYKKLLETGQFKNFITSACPSVNRMIQLYYPKALKYLAPVDSPMVAHAKILQLQYPSAKIVFIGPCIAKKREASESLLIDGVLTFEDLQLLLDEKEIVLSEISSIQMEQGASYANLAKIFPISHGVIRSFETLPEGYEYMAVDGTDRCAEVLEHIDSFSGVFLELNSCRDGCVNGPCSLMPAGNSIKATAQVRAYASKERKMLKPGSDSLPGGVTLLEQHKKMRNHSRPVTEREITEVLARTGKTKPEDELNCGACGYSTCREKAWAVLNGYADIEMCLPYMRKRAESMSYEIIRNNPEGVVVLDRDMKIVDINSKAAMLLGMESTGAIGRLAVDFFNPADFMTALAENRNVEVSRMFIPVTGCYIDLTISLLSDHGMLFGIMKDVTRKVNYDDKLSAVKMETLMTTDEVIKKQMRVAQEIASLLGETTAETKVALLKLKKTLQQEECINDR